MAFYKAVFGWTFLKWGGDARPYWLITTGPEGTPGINGGLMPKQHPEQPCVNSIMVPNLDESLAAVAAAGGECVVPKMPIPSVGWLAYCKDLDGHIFGMMQQDPTATGPA
jgi:predicted enzyme related to lactoylglutathione lyase